jgi:phosphohistidine phosphatase
MKRVILVRHAKSVPYGYDDDFNRDLTERGETDAGKISSELNKLGIKPDIMISSPAKRAKNTAQIFAENLNFTKSNIREVKDIYHGFTTSEFVELIQELPETATTVYIFGHNPGFNSFANNLLEYFNGDMPTCSTVGIDFQVDSWKKVSARTGSKAFHLVPRMFK